MLGNQMSSWRCVGRCDLEMVQNRGHRHTDSLCISIVTCVHGSQKQMHTHAHTHTRTHTHTCTHTHTHMHAHTRTHEKEWGGVVRPFSPFKVHTPYRNDCTYEYPNAETPPFHLHVPLSLGLGPVSKWITICSRILYHSLRRIVHRSHRNIQVRDRNNADSTRDFLFFSSPHSCWNPRDLPIAGDRTKRYRYGTSTIWLPLMLTQASCYGLDSFQNIDEFSGVRMTKSQKKVVAWWCRGCY